MKKSETIGSQAFSASVSNFASVTGAPQTEVVAHLAVVCLP